MVGAELGTRALSSDQARTAGLLPGLVLASAVHVALLALVPGAGAPAAAPEPTPVTLVSIPSPQPPPVAPEIAEEPPAPDPPIPLNTAETPPVPVAQAPEPAAEAPPTTSQAPPVTPAKARPVSTPRPPTVHALAPVARPGAIPASGVAGTRPASDASSPPPASPAVAETSFEAALLQAVQAEARRSYPAAARLMGSTGQAVVAFEYRDGAVHVTGLAQTSGSPLLDRAAIAAVQNASYPTPPDTLAGRTLVKVVHVRFELTAG